MTSSVPPMPPGLATRVVERVKSEAGRDRRASKGAVALPRRPRRLDRRLKTAGRIAAVIVALTLIAFGLLPLLGQEDAAAALREAAQQTAAQGTARVALRTVIQGHVTSPSSPTDTPPDFSITTELQGTTAFRSGMHLEGYVKVRGNAPDTELKSGRFDLLIARGATYDVGTAGLSKRTEAPPVGQAIEGPDSILEMLSAGARAEIENVGEERLRGVAVSHYRFELPTGIFLAPFASDRAPEWVADAWIADEDKTLRQFSATAQATAASPTRFAWQASLRGTLAEFGSKFETPPGSITSEGSLVLPLAPGRGLAAYRNRPVIGRSVPIQSVVGDESFWVGQSRRNRVLVRLARSSESPPDLRTDDTVDFVGAVRRLPMRALGVTAAEGRPQLEEQGHYVQVPFDKLNVTRT
jgi:hypothetical protein